MWEYRQTSHSNDELYHHGVLGMKWGVRKKRYSSTNLRAYAAKRRNDKVDKGFKNWNKNANLKKNAIESGKRANLSRMVYETTGTKEAKKQYKVDRKQYKKDLRKNTTYRKGDIKNEVGQDISRKYLSEAKRVQKQLQKSPGDRQLQKQYNHLMSQHDIERDKARRAPAVAQKRSAKKASIKRGITMSVKAAVTTAAVGAGLEAAKRYGNININMDAADLMKKVKKGKDFLGFFM